MKTIKNLFVCLFVVMMLFTNKIFINGEEVNTNDVTVAYIDYNDFVNKENKTDLNKSGYAVEYLNKISEYTGRNYKFIDVSWPIAYGILEGTITEGDPDYQKVDLYCVARQTEERQAFFDFSLYPICNEEMNIYTLSENNVYYNDFEEFDKMKIGMLIGSGEIDYFKEYEKENFKSEIIDIYPSNKDAISALIRKEVDAVAIVNYSANKNLKLIGNFGVSPAYMMSTEGSEYMVEFSKAQEKLYFDEPDYLLKLEKKYYQYTKENILLLTRSEQEYINSIKGKTLNVAISYDMAPIEYSNDNPSGLTYDIYQKISEMTGLNFNYVKRGNPQELIEQMNNHEVSLVGTMGKDPDIERKLQIKQTSSFMNAEYTIVTENMDEVTKDSYVATPRYYPLFEQVARNYGYTNFKYYDSIAECVKGVYKKDAELTFILSSSTNYLLSHTLYTKLNAIPLSDSTVQTCLGVSSQEDPRLLSIINKCLSTFSDEEINKIMVNNTSNAVPEKTFYDYFSLYGHIFLIVLVIVISLIYLCITQVIKVKQKQEISNKIKEQHNFLNHLYNTLPCGVFQYEYEKPHKVLTYNAACINIYGYSDGNKFLKMNPLELVTKDCQDEFCDKFDECINTEKPVTYVLPISKENGDVVYTECVLDIVNYDNKKVFQEVFIDVTSRVLREREIEKRYLVELNREVNVENGLVATMSLNITKQELINCTIESKNIHTGMNIQDFIDYLSPELRHYQSEEWINNIHKMFTIESTMEAFDNGKLESYFTFCRRLDNKIYWLKAELSLKHHPNGDLMYFIYLWDITEETISNTIMMQTTLSNCELYMSIDTSNNDCLEFIIKDNKMVVKQESKYFENDLLTNLIKQSKDEESILNQISLDKIKEKLTNNEHYILFITLYDKNNIRSDKGLTYFYVDKAKEMIAVTISDVTKIRKSEIEHAELLRNALESAEKAGQAKSQFLSRVSHEMRTPLNAIIGFIELSKGASKEKMENYLASSDLAAKQLLNVINDVLDMSSIESGKMKIASAPFNFRHVLSSITNIYGTQSKQKGLIYETKILTPTDDWIIGDELRINQILMNILGNSIKFTEKGHIWLKVSQTNLEKNRIMVRFEISDTGNGMSEEMQQRLFKPFEQENASTARKYGGSGLGLSIVKNLVTMMNGQISVKSKLGEGTTFTIDMPFTKNINLNSNRLSNINKIESIHVLAIDDEEQQLEYMRSVLSRLNIRFTCINNGIDAIKELERVERENDDYNVVLVDWKMPGLDGLQTTRNIRKKYDKDVVVIIVSAYDFEQATDTVKEAGANMFLSKPIFQSSLFDLFVSLTGGKILKQNEQTNSWNFVGKRVLVAEDNALNQIVCKGYLKKFNLVCDIAENGKVAIEKFLSSSDGFYDAILMDIQMPIMDGFEATKIIRESNHPQAKTIQIIAQTADAFGEDISKALSAGMNAHISKPIKPDVLGKALFSAFTNNTK